MVTCAQCGEELLGSVNRCWRCGTEFALHADQDWLPPVRRSPVSPANARTADGAPGNRADPIAADMVLESTAARTGGQLRRGSPFNGAATWESSSYVASARGGAAASERAPVYLVAGFSAAGVAAFSFLLVESLPVAAMALAAFAVGLAVVALYGPRRWVALAAILLAITSFGWAGYEFAIQIYILRHGSSPWSKDPPVDAEFDATE